MQAAVAWAAMHSTDSIDDAATICEGRFGDTGMPVAGEGAPLVAEFAITEFAAAIGVSTDAGKRYVGHALELAHRLPRVWRRVVNGDLRPWLARRIADQTLLLSPRGRGVRGPARRHVAHKIGPVQLERLVDEAIATYMPDLAEERRLAKADGRYFTIEQQQISYAGTAAVHGELDLADALDLEQAISGSPPSCKDLGSEDSLNVRRAAAVGELARTQLALASYRWLRRALRARLETTAPEAPGRPLRPPLPSRPRRHRHRQAGARQPAGHRRPGPRVVRNRRHRHREAGARPRSPRPRRLRLGARPARRGHRGPRQDLRLPLVHPIREPLRHRPHHPRRPRRTRPARAISRRYAGDITGSRPTAAGRYTTLEPGHYLWTSSTATSTSATPTAPSTSAPTAIAPPTSYPAPDPAASGATGTPASRTSQTDPLHAGNAPLC